MQWQSQGSTPGLGWPAGMVQDMQPCMNALHWFKAISQQALSQKHNVLLGETNSF